jgi:hypothetical protein
MKMLIYSLVEELRLRLGKAAADVIWFSCSHRTWVAGP